MAITGVNDSAREQQQYQRRLRELGEHYSEDVGKQKDRYNANIEDISNEQKKLLAKVREDKEQVLLDQRVNQERAIERLSDRYEKQGYTDTKTHYDRYGRAQEDSFRELNHAKKQNVEQINNLVEGQEKLVDGIKRSREEEVYSLKRQQDNEKFRVGNESTDKLEQIASAYEKQAKTDTKEFTQKLNSERRMAFEEARKNKAMNDLRLEQQMNQADNHVNSLKSSFNLREKQLVDERDLHTRRLQQTGSDSLNTYRDRLTDNLTKVQADSNFDKAKSGIVFSNALARQNSEARLREQDMRLAMERSSNDMKYVSEAKDNKQTQDSDMMRRRIVHDDAIAREGMKKGYEDTISELNAEHSSNLQMQKRNIQEQFDTIKSGTQARITKLEAGRANEDQERRMKNQDSARNTTAEHLSERHRIANAYEQKMKALENKSRQSAESQTDYHRNEGIREYRNREHQIAANTVENMDKMYKQKVNYEAINEMQNKEHKSGITTLEDQHRLRTQMLTAVNAGNIEDMQKIQNEQLSELQRENSNQMAKQRADLEMAIKNMSFDYEYRLRTMAQNYEQKLAEAEMTTSREFNTIKGEHERASRAATARHRTELQNLQDTHKKEMALQETQYKDRMKLQDENQKVEVSRLRHSNELLRLKS